MSKQPEALRLANDLLGSCPSSPPLLEASVELRRQHALIAELVEALQRAVDDCIWPSKHICSTHEKAIAALAKADAQQ